MPGCLAGGRVTGRKVRSFGLVGNPMRVRSNPPERAVALTRARERLQEVCWAAWVVMRSRLPLPNLSPSRSQPKRLAVPCWRACSWRSRVRGHIWRKRTTSA